MKQDNPNKNMGKQMTLKQFQKKGGLARLKKYGREAFVEMAKKSWENRKPRPVEYYSEIGKKSAEARRKRKEEAQKKEELDTK